MTLHPHLEPSVDVIDAIMFSGDIFICADQRVEFQKYLDRWAKKLREWQEFDEDNA
jgi:hypothetical protein